MAIFSSTYTGQFLHIHRGVVSSHHHPETSILGTVGLLGLQEEIFGGQTARGVHKLHHILHRLRSLVLDCFLFISFLFLSFSFSSPT